MTQVLVKAFLLRGSSEVASVQLAVTLHDKEQLNELDARIQVLDDKASAMKERPEDFGGADFVAQVQKLEAMTESSVWLEKGKLSVEEAKKKAEMLQETTTKDLERMVNKIMETVDTIRHSDEYQSAIAQASDVATHA